MISAKNGLKGQCALYVTWKVQKSNAQGVTVKKTVEEFGYSKNNKLFANFIQCREKRKEYNRKYKKPDDEPSEIVTVFNHTRQLLLNDELLENYFLIFSKQDNKVIIEIPMNDEVKDMSSKQPVQTSETNSFSKLYRIMHS